MTNSSLQLVELISSNGKYTTGLVSVRDAATPGLCIDEQAAVFDAASFKQIDFVFFRRFSDGRSSQISAYVIDNSDNQLDEQILAQLHQQIWLHGAAPLLYVAWPSRIDVLTCARGPDFWKVEDETYQYNPVRRFEGDALKTAGEIASELRKFSALRLSDGTFWDDPDNAGLADYANAAHQLLIQAVVEADSDLEGNKNPILRRLLLLTVLIKYLEDRRVFPNDGWFGSFHKGAQNFFEVLQGGDPDEVYRLLSALERKFDGDIFALPHKGQEKLTTRALNRFAELVEAKTLKRQRYLWVQFSFEHLPVEIISHLYQRFVQSGHGIVYTPPFLASLLLDHAMPYEKLTGEERVLDPACGSGVFLVGAFRRLINVWRSRNGWQRPNVDALKKILKQSIYGIDLDASAIHLTAFSLCLAISDALQPDVIWKNLKFDRLRKTNLFEKDFYQILLDAQQGKSTIIGDKFDVVIGNPPFESELTIAGIEVNKTAIRQDESRGTLPDKQSAYLFLEQAFTIIRSDGRVCLIQPSGLLYNYNARAFRSAISRKHRVDIIFDFTSIRKLFDEADPKTVALLMYYSMPSEDHWIKHWTFRRTVSVQERICFELDHYDRHLVPQKVAETDSHAWRANLLGGGRLLDMSQRLRSMRTLKKYLTECKDQKGWDYGEGFIAAKSGRRTPAPFLKGAQFLPTNALTVKGINKSKIKTVTETRFRTPYTKDRYSAPLILIREMDSLPIDLIDKGFIAYRNQIVGIHAPHSQVSELSELYNNLRRYHKIYRFSCALNSTRSLVSKATSILKQDIDELPYPEEIGKLSFSFWEEALCDDVLKHMTQYVRLGQNSDLLEKTANPDDLREYSSMFVRMLSSVYENLKASEPIFISGLSCQPFYFGEHPTLSWVEQQAGHELRELIYADEQHKHLRTIRVVRFYSENVLLLVKPDRLRYWIRSTAIQDADETLIDLRRQGY